MGRDSSCCRLALPGNELRLAHTYRLLQPGFNSLLTWAYQNSVPTHLVIQGTTAAVDGELSYELGKRFHTVDQDSRQVLDRMGSFGWHP